MILVGTVRIFELPFPFSADEYRAMKASTDRAEYAQWSWVFGRVPLRAGTEQKDDVDERREPAGPPGRLSHAVKELSPAKFAVRFYGNMKSSTAGTWQRQLRELPTLVTPEHAIAVVDDMRRRWREEG